MQHRATRIDLLELDIDLRMTDLWREAAGIEEWNLEVVAAFMRAAYGKGTAMPSQSQNLVVCAPITATAYPNGKSPPELNARPFTGLSINR